MHCIDIEFRRADEWKLIELMDAIGVYSLWSGRASARPSYIGEGDVLTRIVTEHMKDKNKIGRTVFDGYIGVLGYKPGKELKRDAEIVEALLLYIADEIGRFPVHNTSLGKHARVDRVVQRHPTLRVTIRGHDPLRAPGQAHLRDKKVVTVRRVYGENVLIHGWHKRACGA